MTRHQLEHAVAGATGESLRTIRGLGFAVLAFEPEEPESDGDSLVLDCPFCGHPVPYLGHVGDGSAAMAECDSCDVYFDPLPDEVYLATGALV